MEIGELSESTQVGVTGLQASMREAVYNLGQFRIDSDAPYDSSPIGQVGGVTPIRPAARVHAEDEMDAQNSAQPSRASV
jgi:hypothetical protein